MQKDFLSILYGIKIHPLIKGYNSFTLEKDKQSKAFYPPIRLKIVHKSLKIEKEFFGGIFLLIQINYILKIFYRARPLDRTCL